MQFGFTLKPENSIERTLALTRRAEAAGFEYGWLFDSHVLWREPYVLLTLMAGGTQRPGPRTRPAHRRAAGDGVHAGRPQRGQRRTEGPGDRPRRFGSPRAGQAAHDDGYPR